MKNMLLLLIAVVSMSMVEVAETRADPIQVNAPANPLTYLLEARARNGQNGFEGVLFTDCNPSPSGITMNPSGAPVWQYNTAYPFKLTFNNSTGAVTWQIDFNLDNDFLDAQESVTSTCSSYIGTQVNWVNLYLRGNTAVSATVQIISINGESLGQNYASNGEVDQNFYFIDNDGSFTQPVVVEGTFSFSGGSGQERPRVWVRLSDDPLPTVDVSEIIDGTGLWLASDEAAGLNNPNYTVDSFFDVFYDLAAGEGNNDDATAPLGSREPFLAEDAFDGLPGACFSSSSTYDDNDAMSVEDTEAFNLESPKSLFVVFKTSSNISDRQTIAEFGGVRSGYNLYIHNGNIIGGFYNTNPGEYDQEFIATACAQNTTYLVVLEYTGNSYIADGPDLDLDPDLVPGKFRMIVNGDASATSYFDGLGSNPEGSANGIGSQVLGTRYADQVAIGSDYYYTFNGCIGEVILIDQCDPTEDGSNNAIFDYLGTKFSLTSVQYPYNINFSKGTWEYISHSEVVTATQFLAPSPNPSNGNTQFGLSLVNDEFVQIDVFNATGLKVANVHSGNLSKGEHMFSINGSELPNGAYFLNIQGTSFSQSAKIIVNR